MLNILFALSLGAAFAAEPSAVQSDPILVSMQGVAWEGRFQLSIAGARNEPIAIRFVNNDQLEPNGRQGYHYAIAGNQNELASIIQRFEPNDDAACAQTPGLSSERFTELHSQGMPGAYSGTVFVSQLVKNQENGLCEPKVRALTVRSFIVSKEKPRTLDIVIEPLANIHIVPLPEVEIIYHFTEVIPKPVDWKAWLISLNP